MPVTVVKLLRSKLLRCTKSFILNVVRRFAITQEYSVLEQLNYGSRYLDLRPVVVKDDQTKEINTFISHGLLGNDEFPMVLKQIASFLKTNKKEFIILDIYCLRAALRLQLPVDMMYIE